MFDLSAWLIALAAVLVFGVLGWFWSLIRRDVSIVDSMWSLMFLITSVCYAAVIDEPGPRIWLVLILTGVWAVRLSIYISWRNWGEGEDYRYRQIRRNNSPAFEFKSLYIVFGLQAVLAWFISLPLLAAIASPREPGILDGIGAFVWLVGMTFETVGDLQLTRFKADPRNAGKVLQSGLWRLTRHPNYFGDFCVWWGFFLIALSAGGWWAIVSPLLMSFLLLKVSGVALLEKDIGERRPGYADYIARTNAFFPGPPKDGASASR